MFASSSSTIDCVRRRYNHHGYLGDLQRSRPKHQQYIGPMHPIVGPLLKMYIFYYEFSNFFSRNITNPTVVDSHISPNLLRVPSPDPTFAPTWQPWFHPRYHHYELDYCFMIIGYYYHNLHDHLLLFCNAWKLKLRNLELVAFIRWS